ncbi:MAG TPA: 5-methyltetrahydropteroyltriglutamate--homocysteine methyltransferase [Candidatus Methylomirabilis sp.]|nr:5-methyltetrahydropteroyltriglutamate--homocysteine methyltransferase [Candidatus Methylomirabilis sp.]
MEPVERHLFEADRSFDGGDLDCGNGLLLLIRQHIDPLERGQLLEFRSTESSVEEDFPAWCRLTGNELVSLVRRGKERSFLVCKGTLGERRASRPRVTWSAPPDAKILVVTVPATLPPPAPAASIPPLAVMGVGSWPRPRWMLQAIHDRIEGRLGEAEFDATGDDATRLAVAAQLRAGVDVLTDGEQRRDNYASFVGSRLDNCQLIPLTDLLPLVDDPATFEAEMRSLDVPASEVRHPAVFGALGRSRPLAVHELRFVQSLVDKPVKVALPGPYLLTRIMWMECISDRAYRSREHLAEDIVRVLREEIHFLLAAGAALVQLDEPVLSEVVFTGAKNTRTFMCGALSEKGDALHELRFARDLVNRAVAGLPRERLAVHLCRGNWTRDERAALAGDYRPLLPLLQALDVGTYFLELATPRAGEIEVLADLPRDRRVGLGVVNQKDDRVESVDEIRRRAERAMTIFGPERVLLTPDCGFATFADSPVASAQVAEAKLRAIADAAAALHGARERRPA